MEGYNTQYNGRGFTDQKFTTLSIPQSDFDAWVSNVKQNGMALDQDSYKIIAQRGTREETRKALGIKNSVSKKALYFRLDDPALFKTILHRYHSDRAVERKDQPGTAEYGQQP